MRLGKKKIQHIIKKLEKPLIIAAGVALFKPAVTAGSALKTTMIKTIAHIGTQKVLLTKVATGIGTVMLPAVQQVATAYVTQNPVTQTPELELVNPHTNEVIAKADSFQSPQGNIIPMNKLGMTGTIAALSAGYKMAKTTETVLSPVEPEVSEAPTITKPLQQEVLPQRGKDIILPLSIIGGVLVLAIALRQK